QPAPLLDRHGAAVTAPHYRLKGEGPMVTSKPRQSIAEAASEFLSQKRIAVTGVSRTPGSHGSNAVFERLRDRGYEVFAVNPNAESVAGGTAYHDLHAI